MLVVKSIYGNKESYSKTVNIDQTEFDRHIMDTQYPRPTDALHPRPSTNVHTTLGAGT